MRVPALLLLSGLALTAGACASTKEAEPVAAVVVAASSPQPIDGYDWFYHEDGREARLAYGLEASDDLRIGMDCRRGGGQLELSTTGAKDAVHEIYVEAGGETERFAAAAEPSQLHDDGVFLTAQAGADEPVFQRFRQVGWLALWADGERETYAPHPSSRDNIEKFFVFCG